MSTPRARLAPAVLLSILSIVGIVHRAAAVQYQAMEVPAAAAPATQEGQIAFMVEMRQPPAARIYANVMQERSRGLTLSAHRRRRR